MFILIFINLVKVYQAWLLPNLVRGLNINGGSSPSFPVYRAILLRASTEGAYSLLTRQFCHMQEPGYMGASRLLTMPHPYTKSATRAFGTATFGLRLALRLFKRTNNDVTTSTVSNKLLHVSPRHAGGIACCSKQKYVLVYEPPRAWGAGKGVK